MALHPLGEPLGVPLVAMDDLGSPPPGHVDPDPVSLPLFQGVDRGQLFALQWTKVWTTDGLDFNSHWSELR
jgi:hypothetical protein